MQSILLPSSGSYSFSFNRKGIVYFSSGCIPSDDNCNIIMRGAINVMDPDDEITVPVKVTLNGVEANYPVSIA